MANHTTRPLDERFWSHVKKLSPDECWIWTANLHPKGYGLFNKNGKCSRAHRIAWELVNGPIQNNLHVLHKCDNRACCNPSHLFLGTTQENTKDMLSKGREARGERMGSAKLTAIQVEEIRNMYAQGGISQENIARKYGVDRGCIKSIINGETWKHLSHSQKITVKNIHSKITEAQVREIRSSYAQGNVTYTELARRYEISDHQVSMIVRRKNWAHIE